MKLTHIITTTFLMLMSLNVYAVSVDGSISSGEYQWNTNGVEGSDKGRTYQTGGGWGWWSPPRETHYTESGDAIGGSSWDISYLGTSIVDGQFQFGAQGGSILSGNKTGSIRVDDGSWHGSREDIVLSDFAISVNNTSADPTTDSSSYQYAIRLLSVNDGTGVANFAVLGGGTWEGVELHDYNRSTETYKMVGGDVLTTFDGIWNSNSHGGGTLEGGFDLTWLSLFDPSEGGTLSTYLTMTCVNDEALVHAYVAAEVSAVPIPAALWLFTPALAGLIGFRRRSNAKS
ncbi:MAG: hypothetical protein COA90_09500 [Gammaproteobacteria bacterium]|nr:MAG: hypothetical protein COA90_09500 [Gammaproteobacteria bacterium]